MLFSHGLFKSMSALVHKLESEGAIKSEIVKTAFLHADRKNYIDSSQVTMAYSDQPLGIGHNATISAPHMHALALELMVPKLQADTQKPLKVLDVGSGSGYLSVVIALMLKANGNGSSNSKVVGIDHIPELVSDSIANVRRDGNGDLLDSGKLVLEVADGRKGYPQMAPYDIIHVGAASKEIPKELIDQLSDGGIILIPVGDAYSFQYFQLGTIDPQTHELNVQNLTAVRFVPLTSKEHQEQ